MKNNYIFIIAAIIYIFSILTVSNGKNLPEAFCGSLIGAGIAVLVILVVLKRK